MGVNLRQSVQVCSPRYMIHMLWIKIHFSLNTIDMHVRKECDLRLLVELSQKWSSQGKPMLLLLEATSAISTFTLSQHHKTTTMG